MRSAPAEIAVPPASVPWATALRSAELALAAERAKRKELEREVAELKSANEEHEVRAAELDADVMLGRQQAAELAGLQQETTPLRSELATASKQLTDLRKKLRGVRKEGSATPDRVLFRDPARNCEFLLNSAWATQIPEEDKDRLTLGAYRLGDC